VLGAGRRPASCEAHTIPARRAGNAGQISGCRARRNGSASHILRQAGLRQQDSEERPGDSLLVAPGNDVVDALERLADTLGAPDSEHLREGIIAEFRQPHLPEGRLTVEKACQTLAALQPDGAIMVEEAITSCSAYYPVTKSAAPHTLLTVAGGNIGWGLPCAIGAALACPERPVIALEGDGSAMYTIQALWTQARESLNITTLIFSNGLYNAVRLQFARDGVGAGTGSEAAFHLEESVHRVGRACRGDGGSRGLRHYCSGAGAGVADSVHRTWTLPHRNDRRIRRGLYRYPNIGGKFPLEPVYFRSKVV